MSTPRSDTRVLIVVMTYPHPFGDTMSWFARQALRSLASGCGFTPGLSLSPFPSEVQKVPVDHGSTWASWSGQRQPQGERKPNLDSITLVGEPLSTKNGWAERREIIDSMPCRTQNQLKSLFDSDHTSLELSAPKKVIDLEVRPATDSDWKPCGVSYSCRRRYLGNSKNP